MKLSAFLCWKDDVQALRELLEETHEFKAQVFVIKQIEERVVIGQIGEPMFL